MSVINDYGAPGALERLAERQDGVVSVAQALAAGLTHRQIAWRRAAGRYTRCRRRVVQIAGAPPTWRQKLRTAAIAAGDRVAVSHGSAVRLYGIEMPKSIHRRWRRDNAFLELSAPDPRHVRLEGVRGHRSGMWEEGDITSVAAMAVTSPVRTVIDLSSRLGVEGTGRLVDDMLRRKLITMSALRDRLTRVRPAPGRSLRVLRAVVAVRDDSFDAGESKLESRIRRVIAHQGFPSPVGQYPVRDESFDVRLDFAFPEVKVYLEGDGFGFHRMRSDLDHDIHKRNGLLARGWIGLHITATMTNADIERLLSTIYDRSTRRWRPPR